jgi:hypothetical protein
MVMLGVVCTALALLFLLTALALWASEQLRHPLAAVAGLGALLVLGLALLFE